MRISNVIRVAATAVVLTTLSFAAGVAGDLSDAPTDGVRVVLRIPPEIPADAIRAAPLPPRLVSTASAEAAAPRRRRAELGFEPIVLARMESPPLLDASFQPPEYKVLDKPPGAALFAEPRKQRVRLTKPERRKGR